MSEKKTKLTYAGLKNFEQELQELKTVKRKDVAEKIKEARGQGDLSENAEYDAAKEEQAEIESRIVILEKLLRNAEVIDEEELNQEAVSTGSIVKLYDAEFEEEVCYTIVGSSEADPFKGNISDESPLGQALLHRGVGEDIEVTAPDGVIRYKILEIQIPGSQRP
ncbi:MAG: transcription elongation factor GreA [Clostridiales bacterium]|jgi:transcription elongation factor GreA|nr:transcription elongation factor GreA [Clostridiales bacterium]